MRRNTIDTWNRIIALVFGVCVVIAALGLLGVMVGLGGEARLYLYSYLYMLVGGSTVAALAYDAMRRLHQEAQLQLEPVPVRIRKHD